jgi:biopolymer transport protein ExbB/TolQ
MNNIGEMLEDACYIFLAGNMLWGLYCVIMLWLRLKQLQFASEDNEHEFVDYAKSRLTEEDWASLQKACNFDFRAVPRLTLLLVANRKLDFVVLRQMLATRVQRDILRDLEVRLSWLVTVIKGGPLLGLFGTVMGMMAAFGRIGTGEKVQPSQIAEDISIALICTALGLATAIPLGYILSALSNRVNAFQESLGTSLEAILEVLRPTQH